MTSPESPDASEASLKQVYDRTRMSLIDRLADWEDQKTWDEFYQTYWRLIYSVSLKAGLGRDEAMDAVQETIFSIAKQWRAGQQYDPARGSFKTWLMNMTRWRIADQFRKKQRNPAANFQSGGSRGADGDFRDTATIERLEDEDGDVLERLWDLEWKSNLTRVALDRVKLKISPKQFQIFDAYVMKGWETDRVKNDLGVSLAQVYLAKHRVGGLLRKEIEALTDKFD
ncbi:MAG: sigma-70 family RNA polymerase sigma factor [Verrucomicrobiae bacterium]|nr:sigma-70 family RNA polymerase sigma factor [Verrucomicrobiae bacterium]